MIFSLKKCVAKGSEPVVGVVGLTVLIGLIAKRFGIQLDETSPGVIAAFIYGCYRSISNYVKNRKNVEIKK